MYNRIALIKENTVFNKRVPHFVSTLYIYIYIYNIIHTYTHTTAEHNKKVNI